MRSIIYSNILLLVFSGGTSEGSEVSHRLGLAIVKQLVKRNAGTLCRYPASPTNTIFNLELPRAA